VNLQVQEHQELPDIEGAWKKYKRGRIKQFPQNNLRASSVGHPCDRYHYYCIKNWRERPLHNEVLQSIFDEGNLQERSVIQSLQEMGFEVINQQRSFQLDNPLITGHVDGILRWKEHDFPFDVKSISPHDFPKLVSAEDFLYSKKLHQRNYIAQLQIYLLITNNPIGCLITKNKLTGQPKVIWTQQETVTLILKEFFIKQNGHENLCTSCYQCNRSKSNKLLSEWGDC